MPTNFMMLANLDQLEDALSSLKTDNISITDQSPSPSSYFKEILEFCLRTNTSISKIIEAINEAGLAFDINTNSVADGASYLHVLFNHHPHHTFHQSTSKEHEKVAKLLKDHFSLTAQSEINPGVTIAQHYITKSDSLRLPKTLENLIEIELIGPEINDNVMMQLAGKINSTNLLHKVIQVFKAHKFNLQELAYKTLVNSPINVSNILKIFNSEEITINFQAQTRNCKAALTSITQKAYHNEVEKIMEELAKHNFNPAEATITMPDGEKSFATGLITHHPYMQEQLVDLIKLLHQHNVDITQKDANGRSALHEIANRIPAGHNIKENKYVFKALAESKVSFGETFLAFRDKAEISELLRAYKEQEIEFNNVSRELADALMHPPGMAFPGGMPPAMHTNPISLLQGIFRYVHNAEQFEKVMKFLHVRKDINWDQMLEGPAAGGQNSIFSKIAFFNGLTAQGELLKTLELAKDKYGLKFKLKSSATLSTIAEGINPGDNIPELLAKVAELGFEVADKAMLAVLFASQHQLGLGTALELFEAEKFTNDSIDIAGLQAISQFIGQPNNYWQLQSNLNKLVKLGFNQWDSDYGLGKNFISAALENAPNLYSAIIVLQALSNQPGIDFKLSHKNASDQDALDIITSKMHMVGPRGLAYELTDLFKVLARFQGFEPTNLLHKILNRPFVYQVGMVELAKALPEDLDLMRDFGSENLLSKFVSQLHTNEDFIILMEVCRDRFGLELDSAFITNAATYLPRHLLSINSLQQTSGVLDIEIDWQALDAKGVPLFVRILQKSDGAFIRQNFDYFTANLTGIDWYKLQDAHGNNLLQVISEGDELERWNLVEELVQRSENNRPVFNVNNQNKLGKDGKGDRLIDKAKLLLDATEHDPNRQNLFNKIKSVIQSLREQGSVEPKEYIITGNLKLDSQNVHASQNYQSLPKLKEKLHQMYNLDAGGVEAEILDLRAKMEDYIQTHGRSREDREILRNGDGEVTGVISELQNLTNQPDSFYTIQNGGQFTWNYKEEIAYLWACAKANNCGEKFIEVFSGLHACDWGKIVNLFIPLDAAIMGRGNVTVDYTQEAANLSPLVQEKVKHKLTSKFSEAEAKEIIIKAFLDFLASRDENVGGIEPENWQVETQLFIGLMNQAFTEILHERNPGLNPVELIESYHYHDFIQYVVTGIVAEPENYRGEITHVFMEEKSRIAAELLVALSEQVVASEVISEFQEKYGEMLDLEVVDAERMRAFLDELDPEKKISMLKAFTLHKLRFVDDFQSHMKQELADAKKAEFRVAIYQLRDMHSDEGLKTFSKNWVLDQDTFMAVATKLSTEEQQILLPKIQSCNQEFSVRSLIKQTLTKAKEANATKLVDQLLEDKNAVEEKIAEFAEKFGKIDFSVLPAEQVLRLLDSDNQQLIDMLATDVRITVDWAKIINEKVEFLNYLGRKQTENVNNYTEILRKAKEAITDELVDKLLGVTCDIPCGQLIEEFAEKFGKIDLSILPTERVSWLLGSNNKQLVHMLATDQRIIVDWTRPIEENHTLLFKLAHLSEEFSRDAIELYNQHQEWQINHEVEASGVVGPNFGDLLS